MILQFLKQPFPIFRKKWKILLLTDLCVCLILLSFMILGGPSVLQKGYIIMVINCLLIATVCSYLVMTFMPLALKQPDWTTWKYFLCAIVNIIFITFGNIVHEYIFITGYDTHLHVLIHEEYSFCYNLIMMLLFDFAVGLVISIVVYYYIKSDELSVLLYEKDASGEPLVSIQEVTACQQDNSLILLTGKTKEAIMLNPDNLLYIEASGNYAEIHFLKDGKVSQRALRTTIQQLEDALKAYPTIIRCHRAFIVNITYIEKISAYRQGFLLVLKSVDKEMPVSRTYKKNILPIIKN